MSEIRRVAIKLKGEDTIIAACNAAGMSAVKDRDRILVKNSGVKTYYGRDLVLLKQADGTYVLEGDASQKELEELSSKLKAFYGEIIAVKTVQKSGYNVFERKIENNRIKVKVRAFV
jgi:hypothetical protein